MAREHGIHIIVLAVTSDTADLTLLRSMASSESAFHVLNTDEAASGLTRARRHVTDNLHVTCNEPDYKQGDIFERKLS